MDLTSYLPAVAQHGLITHAQALAAGLDERDIARLVRDGTWIRLRKGVYADATAHHALEPFRAAPLQRIRAFELAARSPVVFSHDSAAIIWGLGCPDPRTSPVHIARRHHRATTTSGGVRTHGALFEADDVWQVDGLAVLGSARTAIDMVREHGLWPGMAACDASLRQGVPREELEAVASQMRGWPHKRRVDRAVELADDGAESYVESLARGVVHDLGIGHPVTQLGLSDGRRTVWVDLMVGRHVFEADGRSKYFLDHPTLTPEEVLWEEKKRQDFITGFKLGVSRITMHDCLAGRPAALQRLAREHADTVARFGTEVGDLAPYVVTRRRVTGRNEHSRPH